MSGARTKNKTLAAALAVFGGALGLHRFYLHGASDVPAWLTPIPSALGCWGVGRLLAHGQDDVLSWLLIPLLGLSLTVGCLSALIYALTPLERWNATHNPHGPADAPAGRSHGLTVAVLVFALLAGSIAFMSTLAFSVQKYFEHEVNAEQPADT